MNRYSLIILIIFSVKQSGAQDLHYSNLQSMNQQIIPEFAGLNYDLEISSYYRSQWKSLGSDFGAIGANAAFSFQPQHKINGSHLSGGISFYRENMNLDAALTTAKAVLVEHLSVSKRSKLSLGIHSGMVNLALDPSKGQWGSQHNGTTYDENLPSGESFTRTSVTRFDVGTGAIYTYLYKNSTEHFVQVGFGAQHLNLPNLSFYENSRAVLPIKSVVYGDVNFKLGNENYFQSSVLIQNQAKFTSVLFGGMIKFMLSEKAKTTSSFSTTKKFVLGIGCYYRYSDAFISSVMLRRTNFILNFSYDFTTSSLKPYTYSRGALELQLQYIIPKFHVFGRR